MLDRSYIATAVGTGIGITNLDKTIVPVKGTIIDQLCNLSLGNVNMELLFPNNNEVMTDEDITVTLDSNINVGASNEDPHAITINAYVDEVSKYITNHIAAARSIVKPDVIAFQEKVDAFLQRNSFKEPSSLFAIEQVDIPEILNNEVFLDDMQYMKGKEFSKPNTYIRLADKTHDELINVLLTGNRTYDESILTWVTQKPAEFISEAFNAFFTQTGSKTYNPESLKSVQIFEKIEIALVVYLMADKFLSNPETTIDSMNLSQYKAALKETKDYCAGIIINGLSSIFNFNNIKTMVLSKSVNAAGIRTVRVYKPVYNEWLNNGGSPEILFGYAISDKTLTLAAGIDNKKEEFLKDWESYQTFAAAKLRNVFREDYIRFIKNSVNEFLINKNEFINAYMAAGNSNYVEEVRNRVDAYLSARDQDVMTVCYISMDIVAGCIYYFTSAKQILSSIEIYLQEESASKDVREAALLASIEYVAQYLCDQMQVA